MYEKIYFLSNFKYIKVCFLFGYSLLKLHVAFDFKANFMLEKISTQGHINRNSYQLSVE